MKEAVCIIPVTRPVVAQGIIKALEHDGWDVLYKNDPNKNANEIRSELLELVNNQVTYIRFADDDDSIYPHKDIALNALQDSNIDVVYFDFILTRFGVKQHVKYSGILQYDALTCPAPWSFVIKADALKWVYKLFDPSIPCVQGGHAFFNMIKAGLRFKHVPVVAYEWKLGTNGINSNRNRNIIASALKKEIHTFFKDKLN